MGPALFTQRAAVTLHANARVALVLALALSLAASCTIGSDREVRLQIPSSVVVAGGFELTTAVEGLRGPTQATFDPSGTMLVAEINGGENNGTGRVVAFNLTTPSEREVLVADLDKPTGLAIVDDALWIMERRRLTVSPLNQPRDRRVVADDLPYNGRSEGTLTALADGGLLYNTSGSKRGAVRARGSGSVFTIPDGSLNGAPHQGELLAEGFKHAYARAVTDGGTIFATEMSDGTFDGDRAVDEVVVLAAGDDGGWPFCVGDNRLVDEFADDALACEGVRPSHAVFAPGATPTSITVAPWDANMLLVALWISGSVVSIPVEAPVDGPWEPTTIIDGIESPQYLLPHGDEVLVFDHGSGDIYSLKPST